MDAKQIVKNRRQFIDKLIKQNVFDLYITAEYFETHLNTIKKDVKALGYSEIPNSKNPIDLSLLINKRNEILSREIYKNRKQGLSVAESEEKALTELGFWKMPGISNKLGEQESLFLSAAPTHFEKASITEDYTQLISDILYGNRDFELKEKYNLTEEQTKRIIQFVKSKDQKLGQDIYCSHIEKEKLYDLVKNNTIADISELTGFNITNPSDYFKQLAKEVSEEYKKKYRVVNPKTGKIYEPKDNDYIRDAREQKIWSLYHMYGTYHGYTQQEIADMIGISTRTLITCLKKYAIKHPEEVDKTQLHAQRHTGIKKYEQREQIKEQALILFQKQMPVSEIAKNLECSVTLITSLLKEEGAIKVHNQLTRDQKEKVILGSEEGYRHSVLLSTRTTTPDIMKETGESRAVILNRQRDTAYFLQQNKDAKQEYLEKQGNIEESLEEWEQAI